MYDMASKLCDVTVSPSPVSHTHNQRYLTAIRIFYEVANSYDLTSMI